MQKALATLILLLATASSALAILDPSAPEIDPNSGAAAIALLTGGLVILRSRKK